MFLIYIETISQLKHEKTDHIYKKSNESQHTKLMQVAKVMFLQQLNTFDNLWNWLKNLEVPFLLKQSKLKFSITTGSKSEMYARELLYINTFGNASNGCADAGARVLRG